MKSKTLFFFSILTFLSGCIITNTPGFYSGYNKMDAASQSKIIFVSDGEEICNLKNDKKIYSITASHLRNCLEKNDSSIVYFWSPNCSSKSCISLIAAQKYCDTNNYRLYVITEYYDLEKIAPQNVATLPMFSINHKFYHTDYCNKYVRLFTKELIRDKPLSKEETYNRFYVFSNDTLVKTKAELFTN